MSSVVDEKHENMLNIQKFRIKLNNTGKDFDVQVIHKSKYITTKVKSYDTGN